MTERQICDEALIISDVDPKKCMKCGKCSGACPSYDTMEYHPHEFVDIISKGKILCLIESESTYKCLSCYICTDRCPRNVMPTKLIEAVRVLKSRQNNDSIINNINIDEDMPQQLLVAGFRK